MAGAQPDPADLPTRRERRRLEIRERILEAAVEIFESQGYEETTVSEIASRADIAYGTFFNHFPAKLDLLRELSNRTMQELFANVEELRKRPGTFEEHFVLLFEEAAERAEQMGPQTRELVAAMMTQAYPEKAVSDDRRMRDEFRRFLADGLDSDAVRTDVDLDTLTEVVIGTWYSLFTSWVHFDGYPLCERASAAGRFLARVVTEEKED